MVYAKGISGDLSVALVTFQTKEEITQSTSLQLENITAYNVSTMSSVPATTSSGSYYKDGAYLVPIVSFSGTASQQYSLNGALNLMLDIVLNKMPPGLACIIQCIESLALASA